MKTFLALAAALAIPAFAADPPAPKVLSFRLEPGEVHEECLKLAKGEAKRFEWNSDTNLDFNIHYHQGEAAYYPFKANNRNTAKARFVPDHATGYCWMWTALKAPAQVSATIR